MNKADIEKFILRLNLEESLFLFFPRSSESVVNKKKNLFLRLLRYLLFNALSIIDFVYLIYHLRFFSKNSKRHSIVYTAPNFCLVKDGVFYDRLINSITSKNIIYINQSKGKYIKRIDNIKVYNIGGIVKLISVLFWNKSIHLKYFYGYKYINEIILKNIKKKIDVFMLCYYDLNSLSLVFSKQRHRINLIEVQHGSMINYPPYVKPSPVKIADVFYVKNELTVNYIKNNLNLNFDSEYRLIPRHKINGSLSNIIQVLYASTIEFDGLHPVFEKFVSKCYGRMDIEFIIRLHPRELDKEIQFKSKLDKFNIKYIFDKNQNWTEREFSNKFLIVSPWSSILEEANDLGIMSVVIDETGEQRFKHLIDNKNFYYSQNLTDLELLKISNA